MEKWQDGLSAASSEVSTSPSSLERREELSPPAVLPQPWGEGSGLEEAGAGAGAGAIRAAGSAAELEINPGTL